MKEKKGVSPIKKVKSPGLTHSIVSPSVPAGEDTVSFERHTKLLQVEFKKRTRNNRVIGIYISLNS